MNYDPLGRRIGKREHDQHGQLLGQTVLIWDGLRLLQRQRNTLSSLYVYPDNSHGPLARIDSALQKICYYHNDLNGLPEQLTEADGHLVWHARYQVWGNTAEEVREPYFIKEQNLRFQGQYLDRETGLHYNTFRFYDPDVGRFTTPDPIGLAGGINLYQYAPNPVGSADPLGLSPKCRLTGKQHNKASELPITKPSTKGWTEAITAIQKSGRGYIRVKNAADAKALLIESRGNMDARKMYSHKKQKYSKGYEIHKPQNGPRPGGWEVGEVRVGNDLPHMKWRDGSEDLGHIFFED